MQFICNQIDLNKRLKYTADFIFTTLGINIDLISAQQFKNNNQLSIGYFHPETITNFSQSNIINIANFNELQHLEGLEKNIEIKNIGNQKIPVLGSIFKKEKNINWKKNSKQNFYSLKNSKIVQIEFDIIANIFYHLSRFEERWKIFADEKPIDWQKSVLCRAQNLQIPVVDVILNEFKHIIYNKCKKENIPLVRILPWPTAEKFAVAFTHDVDLTRGYSAKEFIGKKSKSVFFSLFNLKEKKHQIEKEFDTKNSNFWTYPQILDFYQKKNWKATFFFIAKLFEGLHLRYDISSSKFQNLFKEIKKFGHEIALHPSLKAFDNPQKYNDEKTVLEQKSNQKIQGMRQHYLRYKLPRLWNLTEKANFKYDSSLAYNYQAGFRAGTSNGFYTFDFTNDQKKKVLEIPITYFEYSLPEKGQNEIQSKKIIEYLTKQIETYEGILNVLIHPSNFNVSPYAEYWKFLIRLIEKKKIFVATLSEINKWIENRNKIKCVIESKKNEVLIEIKKPSAVKSLGIEMVDNGNFKDKKNVDIEKISTKKFIIQSAKSNFLLTYKLI